MYNQKQFFHTFELSGGVHVYSKSEGDITQEAVDEANGALLFFDDIFFNAKENRAATEEEMHDAILGLAVAKIPNFDGSAALVRVLSGIKPKRISKAKVVIKEPEFENDYDEVDEDEESEEEESQDDDDEEEALEDDEEE